MLVRQAYRARTVTVAALSAAVAALALFNVYLAASRVDISPVAPETRASASRGQGGLDAATPLDTKPVAQFQETVNRPLFNPSRRPVEQRGTTADQGASGDMRLVGVMKAGNQPGRALIRIANEPTGKWIAEGEQINGWKLREVNERRVVIEFGGQSQELKLQSARRRTDEPDIAEPSRGRR